MPLRRHALLVGIDRYPFIENADLAGCLNDVALLSDVLERFAFAPQDITTLRDAEATREGIHAALEALLARVMPGDVAVFVFAGHGSRVADPERPGFFLESLVPYDSGRGEHPNRDLLDHKLDAWVQRLNAITSHVTLILDCCHSGEVTRDPFGERSREAEADLRPLELACPPLGPTATSPTSLSGWLRGERRATVVAACEAHEYASEHRELEGRELLRHGALSFFLGRSLLKVDRPTTWRELFATLAPRITRAHPCQHPVLEGNLDAHLFATTEARPARHLRVTEVEGHRVTLDGGLAHGVATGSEWRLRTPGAHGEEERSTTARVTSVGALRAHGEVLEATSSEVDIGMWASPLRAALPEPGLRIALAEPCGPSTGASSLRVALDASPLLARVDDHAEANLLLRRTSTSWSAVDRDGRLAVAPRAATPGEENALLDDLERHARARYLLAVENPDPRSPLRGAVRLEVRRLAAPHPPPAMPSATTGIPSFREGERADFVLTNTHDADLWVSLLQFDLDDAIEHILPVRGHPTFRLGGFQLPVGQSLEVGAGYYARDPRFRAGAASGFELRLSERSAWPDRREGTLHLKLFATAQPVDFSFLEQPGARSVGEHPLAQALAVGVMGRRAFVMAGEETELDWTTATLALRLCAQQVR